MKGKKKSLLTSLLAIVLCLSLITGSTFALFTSTDKVDITVKSGKVKIAATVDNLKLYSATIEETGDVAGTIETGNHAATYYYEGVDEIGVDEKGYFTNTGTAEYHTTGEKKGTLELDRVTPGDKVTFSVGLTNSSNVNIKYRVVVTVTSGLKLFRALKVKIDGSNLTGVSRTGNWTSLAAEGSISDIPVEIYMPIDLDGEEYMDISTAMTITVEAVQGNAKTTDEILTTEVAAVAEEQVQTNENKETTAETVITDTDNLVTVTIPEGTKLTAAADPTDDLSLAVKVKPQDTVSNITVLSTQASASYDVSVLLVVNGEIDDNAEHAVDNENNEDITVTMFIGTGLTGVKLYHITEEITDFTYNFETGYITFKTTSFSEYTVVYNADFAYEKVDEVTGESEIVVLAATETAGVYVSTDEEGNESYVTVAEDEDGNVTESAGNICLITSAGVTTTYETLAEAVTAARSGDTVKLLNNITVSEYIAKGSSYNKNPAVANRVRNGVTVDGDGHTLTLANQNGETSVFADFGGILKNITIRNINYAICDDAQIGSEFDNVRVEGSMDVNGNQGAFITYVWDDYSIGSTNSTIKFTDCVVDVDMTGTGTKGDYNAAFVGYFVYQQYTAIFTRCINEGDIVCGETGMFIANPRTYNGILIITDCKNNGLIQRTYTEEEQYLKNNLLVARVSDWSYSNITIDGHDYTMAQLKNHELDDKIGGTGSYIVGPVNGTPVLTKNADGTFSFNAMEGAAYYVVSTGLYTNRNAGGSNRNYVFETITESGLASYVSTLKDYKFVDTAWVEANEGAVESEVVYSETEYTVYTLNNESYYLINNNTTENLSGYACPTEMYSLSVFDANGKLLASVGLSN